MATTQRRRQTPGDRRNLLALRYACDARALATILSAIACLLLPHSLSLVGTLAVAWVGLTVILCCCAQVIVHNHMHQPLFHHQSANIAFNLIATIARGHCASDVFVPHNINHHGAQGGPGDWIAPAIAGAGHPLQRLFRFIYRAAWNMARGRAQLGQTARQMLPPMCRRSIFWEKLLLPTVIVLAIVADWRVFLIFQALPWALSLLWLVAINLFQHDGCDPSSRYGHSRNFVGPVINWLFFNNGYHTVHHLQPGLHWSIVPAAHARLQGLIPVQYNEESFWRFFWRQYLVLRSPGTSSL